MTLQYLSSTGAKTDYNGSPLRTLLSDSTNTVHHFYRVILSGDGKIHRFTTSAFDVMVEGNLYSANNGITSMSPLINTNFLDRELFNMEFFDTDSLKLSTTHKRYIGGTIEVYLGFWDMTRESYVGGFHLYLGYIDRSNTKAQPDSSLITMLECTGELSNLELTKGFVGSHEGRRQVNPADTSFENISLDKEEIKAYWGKF